MMIRTRFAAGLLALAAAAPLAAQGTPTTQQPQQQQPRPPQGPRAMPSTRATVEVQLSHRLIGSQWFQTGAAGGPIRIAIDYGQPHLRGRDLAAVVPADSVWRLGANLATHLVTDVDITIGDRFVPRGTYTLFARRTGGGWQLVINRQIGQWGTDYDATADVGRVPLRVRTMGESFESLAIFLVPAGDAAPPAMPRGMLRIVWGNTELSTDWRVGR
jgi:hypothetical protein